MKICLIIFINLLPFGLIAQNNNDSLQVTYHFSYATSGTENFLNGYTNKPDDNLNQIQRKYLAILRKMMYTNKLFEGYANADYTFDFTDTKNMFENAEGILPDTNGHRKSIILSDSAEYSNRFYDRKKNIMTVSSTKRKPSCYSLISYKFKPTNERKIINKYDCQKWEMTNAPSGTYVYVWTTDKIPKIINMNINSDDLNGGIVRIDWSIGIYWQLRSFHTMNTQMKFVKEKEESDNTQAKNNCNDLDIIKDISETEDSLELKEVK